MISVLAVFPFAAVISAAGALIGAVTARLAYRSGSLGRARREALAPVKRITRVRRRVAGLLDRLRGAVLRSSRKFQSHQVRRRLAESPLESLRNAGAGKVRWSLLHDAGIETVGELSAWSVEGLEAIHGVGPQSARAVKDGAEALEAQLWDAPLIPPAAQLEEPGAVPLAREALQLVESRQTLGDVPARLAQASQRLAHKAEEVRRDTGFWAWVRGFVDGRGRDEAIALARELQREAEGVIDGGLLEEAQAREQEARKRSRLSTKRVRSQYGESYATVASAIEQATRAGASDLDAVTGSGLGGSTEEGKLDGDTLDGIERTALLPEAMSIGLRSYQEFGAKFLLAQGRTVLGDEMGLGKTIQALAAMAQLWALERPSHFVVVSPASIILNWKREIEEKSFLPAFVAHGDAKDAVVRQWCETGGVLVISYATLRSYELAELLEQRSIRVSLLIADEAHYIKNPEAGRSLAVGELVDFSERICFMTGTPMENHPREFARIIERLQLPGGFSLSEEELEDAHSGAVSRRFQREAAGIYLRRNQSDVLLELPEKIVTEEWVQLTPKADRAYRSAVAEGKFMAMRQTVTLETEGELAAKMQRLEELLEEHRSEGRKVLIFSFFRGVLGQVARRYETVGTVAGGVSQEEREEMMQTFRDAPGHAILLGQVTAAGQGLNLQAASVVILMEPQLTPGAESQAIARAHRMGQTQRVLVHRLLAADSVDQRIVEILREKEALFDDYARQSVTKDENPEATETHVVQRIIELEKRRIAASGAA